MHGAPWSPHPGGNWVSPLPPERETSAHPQSNMPRNMKNKTRRKNMYVFFFLSYFKYITPSLLQASEKGRIWQGMRRNRIIN